MLPQKVILILCLGYILPYPSQLSCLFNMFIALHEHNIYLWFYTVTFEKCEITFQIPIDSYNLKIQIIFAS